MFAADMRAVSGCVCACDVLVLLEARRGTEGARERRRAGNPARQADRGEDGAADAA